ncbi:MAG: TonB-dependent receptor [Lentisphaerae bacterium]|nr:TonB-dependent receptor [Lentisphaerota bacterium]
MKLEKASGIAVCFLPVVLCVGMVSAAEPEKTGSGEPFDMQEVVVTATAIERKVTDITSAVSVIDSAEIEKSNANYVMDVIGYLPSVYIRRDAIYGRQDIEIRGLGSNLRRIQTLIDGRPEKMSLFGCTVAQTLPLANVERIEVIRGPESVLYGTDAMGGVVNIITRRLLDPGYESSVVLSYGSYETLHGVLRHGGHIGAFDYYITYDRKETDGYRDNSAYNADFLSLRTGYELNDVWRLEFSAQYFDDTARDPGPENAPYTNNDEMAYVRYSWDADLIGKWDNSKFLITIYHNEGEHEFNMPSIDDYWHSKDRTLGVLTYYARDIYEQGNTKDTLTAGYEFKHQWAEPQDDWTTWAQANMPARFMDFGPYERNNHDIFAFNEFTKSRWIQTLGLRGHWDDHAEAWEALPQIGLLCHATEATTARAKIAKGFRQPRFSELHLFPAHNENLNPEEVWSYEVALTHILAPGLSAFVNPFYMNVENFIETVPNDAPPPMTINQNSGEFIIQGIEVGLEVQPVDDLNITVHYTYTDIEDGPADNPNIHREGKPEHVVNAVLGYRIGSIAVSLEGEYVAGLYDSDLLAGGDILKVDDFVVFGLKGTYRAGRNIEVFAGIENLLDENYEQIPGYPMPGTTVSMGVKAQI